MILIYLFFQGPVTFLNFFRLKFSKDGMLENNITLILTFGVYAFLAVGESILLFMLFKTMRRSLNYYYKTKWRKLCFVMIVNILFILTI